MILDDFNVGIEERHMKSLCEKYNLTSFIKQPTCYKNRDGPTYFVDLTLINIPRGFQTVLVL